MKIITLLAFGILLSMAVLTATASGAIPFNGQVEGTNETLSGHLELRQEGWQVDEFKFRSNSGVDCAGPMYQKAGVLHEAVLQCSDGRSGLIKLRLYGQNIISEASLGDRKLTLSMPGHPHHRSR